MQIKNSYIILSLVALSIAIIYFLSLFGWVTSRNEEYVRYFFLGTFILGTTAIFYNEAKNKNLHLVDFYKKQALVVFALLLLLIGSIFHARVGIVATGFFIGASFVYFFLNGKVYRMNKTYYFLFLYALLLLVGTIGTPKGFRFPEVTYSFYLLPLSFCFFKLSQKTLLSIAHVFIRVMIIYLAISVLYWWYNFLYLDVTFVEWITQKLLFQADMVGWDYQLRLSGGNVFAAYFFVSSWAYYSHPSYVSLVLLFGLILSFYLYYKKNTLRSVTKVELALYVILCLVVEVLLESRIGLVGFFFIIAVTGLYYSKFKTNHFKIIQFSFFLLGCLMLFVLKDNVSGFITDDTRKTQYTLAANYIQDHFLWGAGFHQQQAALEQQAQDMQNVLPLLHKPIYYTHNQFMGNMVQFGVLGLLILIVMLSAFFRYSVKERSYPLQMFMSFMILFMMIEEPLYKQEGITRFTVFLVFFIAINESTKKAESFDLKSWLDERKKKLN